MGILRLLLALSVVVAHSGPIFGFYFVGGEIAVKTFFIISGFYMSLILNEKYIGKNNSYRLFISNRFLRLYPIYWAILISTVLLCVIIGFSGENHNFPVIGEYLKVRNSFLSLCLLSISNLFIFGQDTVMFLGIDPSNGSLFFTSNFANTNPQLFRFLFVPQAWTLGLELMFYLIAPFLLRKNLNFILAIIFTSLLLRLYLHFQFGLKHDPWTYRFFPSELMFFLLGYIAYRLYARCKHVKTNLVLNVILFIYLCLFSINYSRIPTLGYPEILKEILYYSSVIVLLPLVFQFFKKSKIDMQIGELSYPVYISHIFVIILFQALGFETGKTGLFVAIVTITISILLNRYIAHPIEKIRQSRITT